VGWWALLIGAVLELLILSLPSLIYRCRLRRHGQSLGSASAAVGLIPGHGRDYLAAAGVAVIGAGLGYAAAKLIPATDIAKHGVAIAHPTSFGGYAAIVLLAAGEEMLFRGWLAGLLIRKLGFARGNALQALIFLAPHTLLLLISPALWPILPAQLIAGWLLGWLRYRSGSIAPASLAHAAANLIAALTV